MTELHAAQKRIIELEAAVEQLRLCPRNQMCRYCRERVDALLPPEPKEPKTP